MDWDSGLGSFGTVGSGRLYSVLVAVIGTEPKLLIRPAKWGGTRDDIPGVCGYRSARPLRGAIVSASIEETFVFNSPLFLGAFLGA